MRVVYKFLEGWRWCYNSEVQAWMMGNLFFIECSFLPIFSIVCILLFQFKKLKIQTKSKDSLQDLLGKISDKFVIV